MYLVYAGDFLLFFFNICFSYDKTTFFNEFVSVIQCNPIQVYKENYV